MPSSNEAASSVSPASSPGTTPVAWVGAASAKGASVTPSPPHPQGAKAAQARIENLSQ
jgi:hypothetical protein